MVVVIVFVLLWGIVNGIMCFMMVVKKVGVFCVRLVLGRNVGLKFVDMRVGNF